MTFASPCPALAAPLPDVSTDRLILRRFRQGDGELLTPVFAKPEFWEFPYGRGFARDETEEFVSAQIAEWDKFQLGCWVAIDQTTGRAVGYLGLSVPHFLPEALPSVEVGWRLDPDFWGRGYATEGASAALDAAFGSLGLDRVCSAPQAENPRSIAVCERLGMQFGKAAVAQGNAKRGPVAVHLYWISRSQWLERKK